MFFEMTMGLFIADQERYSQYRAEMAPLLAAAGGRFRYDMEVVRTLKSEVGAEINRMFVIQFPDRASKERFFTNSEYLEIRARLFDKAVASMTIIAEYSR